MTGLTAVIKKRAFELGFHKVGIAPAGPLGEEARGLEEWLSRGYHATMGWMEGARERRIDPRMIVPGAKSLVSVAINYFTPVEHTDLPSRGKVSRYAWGDDYHEIVASRLDELLAFIKSRSPGAVGKVYVDTGPVMEKAWAQRAGVGWLGKHTNIITEEYGSWVFLGEIILDLELEYDLPAIDRCGSCTLCIEACPTQAIVEPYVVDSNLCISYLTIEHRGPVTPELGDKFEGWIYGCDICQDVCPWNTKFSKPADLKEFQPREQNIAPDLREVAALSQEEFSARYRKSPMKRTKREGLARNAAIVMGALPEHQQHHRKRDGTSS
jgi:epoxyqueuosine reductase